MEEEKKVSKPKEAKKSRKYVFINGKNNWMHPAIGVISQDELTHRMMRGINQYDKLHGTDFAKNIHQVEE